MHAERHVVTITTDSEGAGEGYAPVATGRVLTVRYVKAGSGGYSDGVGATVTLEATGEAVITTANMNASATYHPRVPVQDASGAGLEYADGYAVGEPVVAVHDRVKIAVASGGSGKTGTFHVTIG